MHYKNILAEQTLLASQILCINETKMENIYANKEIHNALLKKFRILCSYEQHGMIMLYDKTISISKWHSIIDHGATFICGTLNGNTHETLHIIIMNYKPPKMQIDYFISIQKQL